LLGGGQRLFSGQRPDPSQWLEADRTHHDQLAGHRLEKQRGLTDDLTELGFDARRADELFQVLQPGATLAAERDRIRLSGVQPIDEGVAPASLSEDSFLRPFVTLVCCLLIVTSCYLPRRCLARIARRLWLSYLELLMACASLRRPCDSASNPDWFRRVRVRAIRQSSDGPADTPAVLRVS
jgi:hypothetical protein